MAKKSIIIKWLSEPEIQDYPASTSYLGLIYPEDKVASTVSRLYDAQVLEFKAKDIFRASGLSLLGVSNYHVKKNIKKIKKGIPLSPIVLVRDSMNGKVIIADGYHRMCAVYTFNEDAIIPCKITNIK
jgi:disulfide oxidoreductase YuzD